VSFVRILNVATSSGTRDDERVAALPTEFVD